MYVKCVAQLVATGYIAYYVKYKKKKGIRQDIWIFQMWKEKGVGKH